MRHPHYHLQRFVSFHSGLLLLVIVAASMSAAWLWRQRNHATRAVVQKGDIVHSFVALGRVESETTVEIAPEFTGRIVEILVREGDPVEEGQVVVRMDDAILRAEYERFQQAAEGAKIRWQDIRRGPRPEAIAQAKQNVLALRGDLELAQAQLKEVLRGPRVEEIKIAEAKVKLSEAEAIYAAKQLEREAELASRQATSASNLDELQRLHDVSRAKLAADLAQLELLRNGATEEEKLQAQANVSAAEARWLQARAYLEELVTGATQEELLFAEAEFKQARADAQRLQATWEETVLKSPLKGVVLRRYKEPGDLAYPQQLLPEPILVLADAEQRLVRVEVVEYDVYKVSLGQRATITSDSYAGRQWTGRITRIAPVMGKKHLASDNPKEKTDVTVLEAWITPDGQFELPFQVPVEAEIVEPVRKNVLTIPIRAVDKRGQVVLLDGSRRKVRLGARDDARVEILDGLHEGDGILIPDE